MSKAKENTTGSNEKTQAKPFKLRQEKMAKQSIVGMNSEHEKAKTFIIVEIIEYVPNSVVIKTIIKKTTGYVTVSSFDTGEILAEKTSPFDTFIQVIDGKAEIFIDGNSNILDTGQSIIIPAHARNIIKANERFKIISTIIKSGYDEIS